MKYVVKTGSGAMRLIPSFHKDWLRYLKVNGGILGYPDSMEIS
jgi:hypothetical protein